MQQTLEELLESIDKITIGPPTSKKAIKRSYPNRLPTDALTCEHWIGTTCCKVDPFDQSKWCSACKQWVKDNEDKPSKEIIGKSLSDAGTIFANHDWGYNKHTQTKIRCNCGVMSFNRQRHLCTCLVWICRDITVQLLNGHEGGVSD